MTVATFVPATEPQIDFIVKLLAQRDVPTDQIPEDPAALSKSEASEKITAFKLLPFKPRAPRAAAPAMPDVPAGYYAVDNEEGILRFYRVDRPTDGKWAGYTFVKVQAGGNLLPVKGQAGRSILEKIEADPQTASVRYGLELGRCGVCNRELTDEESRAAGIGPICKARLGW